MLALPPSVTVQGRMDTDRAPAALLQSEPEVISPVHLGEDTSGTAQPDRSNPSHRNVLPTTPRTDGSHLGPSAALSSTSSDNLYDTSSLRPLRTRSNNDRVQPIQQPSAPLQGPELNSRRREIETNDENGIDWIVPKEEKPEVSNVLILNLNCANSFTLNQAGSKTHGRRTFATYPRQCHY